MEQQEIQTLRALMEYEAARTEPPESFPHLPDIPAGRYTDPRFFELEQAEIFKKSWLFAAHLDEIPEPGCYMTWEQAGEPVVLVHTEEGAVKAFYNVCSHRGAPVVTEPRGKRLRLTCKYHGWSYSLDGELKAIRDPEDFRDLDFSCRSLAGIRCETFGKFIFVNFDPEAVSLLDWLGPIADEWREFQFDQCRLSARHSFDLDCNWKIAMEANTEVYHVPNIHPTTVAPLLDHRRNVNTLYANGHGRMVAPPPRINEAQNAESTRDVGARAEIATVGEIARTCIQSYGIFPNWVSQLTEFVLHPCCSGQMASTSAGWSAGQSRRIGGMDQVRITGRSTTASDSATSCLRIRSSALKFSAQWNHPALRAFRSAIRKRGSTTGIKMQTA